MWVWALGAGVAAAAVALAGLLARAPNQEIDTRPNPVPPSPQSLEMGKRIYEAQCQVCHGVDGHGNGPAAVAQFPRPTDFVTHFASGHVHPDGRLFFWISEGIGGTAMPAFKGRLSETERWDVVNFLKTFTPTER
jgi:mono/diheme cytochrome c family protein